MFDARACETGLLHPYRNPHQLKSNPPLVSISILGAHQQAEGVGFQASSIKASSVDQRAAFRQCRIRLRSGRFEIPIVFGWPHDEHIHLRQIPRKVPFETSRFCSFLLVTPGLRRRAARQEDPCLAVEMPVCQRDFTTARRLGLSADVGKGNQTASTEISLQWRGLSPD